MAYDAMLVRQCIIFTIVFIAYSVAMLARRAFGFLSPWSLRDGNVTDTDVGACRQR